MGKICGQTVDMLRTKRREWVKIFKNKKEMSFKTFGTNDST